MASAWTWKFLKSTVTETPKRSDQPDLLKILAEKKIISAAQVSVANQDMEASGLGAADVLIARRWVNEETLATVAPWLTEPKTPPAKIEGSEVAKSANKNEDDASATYQENLKKYRQLMARILGDAQ